MAAEAERGGRGLDLEGAAFAIARPAVLNRTYSADLRIVRQDGAVLVADAAPHRLRQALRHRHDGYEHSHHEHEHEDHVHVDEALASGATDQADPTHPVAR